MFIERQWLQVLKVKKGVMNQLIKVIQKKVMPEHCTCMNECYT